MNRKYIYLVTSVSALGGFLFGYDTGVINGAQFYFTKFFALDAASQGFVVGSALIGCFVGALVAGTLSTRWGRKKSLIISALLFTLSAWGSGLPEIFPQSVSLLVFFRFIGGLGIGLASMNAPMYIAEIAPAKKRGNLVSYYQLAIVIGFFVVFLTTYLIGNRLTEIDNINFGWRQMFWSELVPSILFFVLLYFVPRSPRWLAIKGRDKESFDVLTKVHGLENAKREKIEIEKSLQDTTRKGKRSYWNKGVLTLILIGAVFSVLQQFTGINAVLYYGADIFEKALGFGKEEILKQQVLLAFVNLIFTFVAMATVDRLGRKPLIYMGSIGMLIGFSLLGMSIKNGSIGLLSLLGVLIFIGSFAMSMGPVVWIVLSEIFPNKIRSLAMSVAVAAQWIANYFVAQTFPMVVESDLNKGAYWNGALPYFLFMFFILFTIIFARLYIPETKGKSLEEIESFWKR